MDDEHEQMAIALHVWRDVKKRLSADTPVCRSVLRRDNARARNLLAERCAQVLYAIERMSDASFLKPLAYLCAAELTAVLVLISPLPVDVRRSIVKTVEMVPAKYASASKYAIAAVACGWLFTLQEALFLPTIADEADGLATLMHDVRRLRSQRSALLGGIALLLLLVIWRLFAMLKEVNQLSGSSEALRKQAEGARAAYEALSDEKDALEEELLSTSLDGGGRATPAAAASRPAEAPAAAAASKSDAEDELERAQMTIAELRERTQKLLTEKESAVKTAEALKKQAEGISTEYARLTTQKESLENKLADYELVLGDQVKKNK